MAELFVPTNLELVITGGCSTFYSFYGCPVVSIIIVLGSSRLISSRLAMTGSTTAMSSSVLKHMPPPRGSFISILSTQLIAYPPVFFIDSGSGLLYVCCCYPRAFSDGIWPFFSLCSIVFETKLGAITAQSLDLPP